MHQTVQKVKEAGNLRFFAKFKTQNCASQNETITGLDDFLRHINLGA